MANAAPSPGDDSTVRRAIDAYEAVDEELWDTIAARRSEWQLSIGPVYLRRYVPSMTLAKLYAAFCGLTFAGGAVLTLLKSTAELGVAIVVGSIFAGGSFLVQFWALQVAREKQVEAEVFGADDLRHIKALLRKHERLAREVEQLDPDYFERHESD